MNHSLTFLTAIALALPVLGTTIPNHPAADLTLGTGGSATDAVSLFSPTSIAIDPVSRKVFVAEFDNSRVLRYASADALASGAAAEIVLGKPDFTTRHRVTNPSAQKMSAPTGVFVDREGRLWVADFGYSRVLMFEQASTISSNTAATKVLGQPDFVSESPAGGDRGMERPWGVCVDVDDRLWVSDRGNSRVLAFASVSFKSNGAAADRVVGQADFSGRAMGNGRARLSFPTGITLSPNGQYLYVADSGNHRVLQYNSGSASVYSQASQVFGQPNFYTEGSGSGAKEMNDPKGVSIGLGDALWVADAQNNRVLRFNNASNNGANMTFLNDLNGAATADGVIGQPDFVSNTPSNDSQSLRSPYGTFVDAIGALWVADHSNNRVQRYSPPAPVVIVPPIVIVPPVPPVPPIPVDKTAPLLVVSGNIPKTTVKSFIMLKGTASDASGIRSVQYRLAAAPLKLATGTTAWRFKTLLKKGLNTLTLTATDTAGNVSASKVIKIKRK